MRLFAIICLIFSLLNYSYASSSPIESVISNANELADKQQAIAQLKSYFENQQLTAKQQVQILNAIANLLYNNDAMPEAITTLAQAKQIAIEHQLKQSSAEISKLIGIYSYFKGDHQQALDAYQFSLDYYIDVDIPIKQAHLYNNIGLVYDSMGKNLFTLEAYEKASKLYHVYGTEGDKIDIRFNIAGLYINLKSYTKAIEILYEVIETRKKLENFHGVAQAYNHLGVAYKFIGEYKLSEEYLLKAFAYFNQNGYNSDAMIELNHLASLHNEKSDPIAANNYAQQVIQMSSSNGFEDAKAYALGHVARANFQLGNIELARDAVAESDRIAVKLNHRKILHENRIIHTLVQAALSNPTQALATFYQYESEQSALASKNLFDAFSKLESQQLSQQISQLKQAGELLALQAQEKQAKQNFLIVIVVFILIILFLFYRRKKAILYHDQLERTVKERTNDLEMVAKQLEVASNVKSQFLANMSHEIRTPLTAILGQSEAIVLGEVKANRLTDEVKVIYKNSQHLLQLVNDILDLSKIEAGKLDLNPAMTNLESITNEIDNIFNSRAKQKGLTFTIVNNIEPPFYFDVDSLRLCQVLINFCSNALKFTLKGEVTLTILNRDKHLVFAVKDTGIGMSSSQVKQIFDCFTQGDSSVNRRFGGTGLGLFLSLNIADLMDADIEVESSLGEGSTFTFILPFKDINQQSIEQLPLNEINNISEPHIDHHLSFVGTILAVDDHSDILRLIKHFLSNLGLTVITANNARDAVKAAVKNQPQVILLDIQMPEIGGVETLSMLKQQGCNQPTYALTANAMAHEVKSYLANGFTGYLQKPINRTDFLAMLEKHFESTPFEQVTPLINNNAQVDLIASFKANLSQDRENIDTLINQQDYQRLVVEVHKIAGAAAMFGFTKLSHRAIELESILKSERYSFFEQAAAEFLAEIHHTVDG